MGHGAGDRGLRAAWDPAIAPWREPVQALGVKETARRLRDAGLEVSGYCRGGLFTAPDAAGRQAAIEDNCRAIDEAAALGAECLILVAGGLPPGSKDLEGARAQIRDGIAAVLPQPAPPGCRSRSSPCTRCRQRIAAPSIHWSMPMTYVMNLILK